MTRLLIGTAIGSAVDVATELPPGRHLIGADWVSARSGATLDVLDPSTGSVLAAVPAGGAADVDDAVRAASDAARVWASTSPRVRADRLHAWGRLLSERGELIASLESLEVGRPYAGPSEVGRTVRYYAGLADKITGESLPTDRTGLIAFTRREPLGVCASIVPWNAPPVLMMKSVAPALAAGNGIVVKPAEDAPLTCQLIGRLALEAGLPPGLVTVVTGYGAEAGAALAAHPGIAHLSFTGSTRTGAAVMKACAENVVPVHLELGGKSAQILLADADLDVAIPTVVGFAVRNAGQICYAGSRLLVHRSIAADVTVRLAAAMERVTIGGGFSGADMGPLINSQQLERVLGYIAVGREEGAELVTGGHRVSDGPFADGNFIEPVVFAGVEPAMRIAREEIFGPVLSVVIFDEVDEAVAIANDTEYGLAASVWTRDVNQVVDLVARLEAGQVYVNTYGSGGAVGAPFGGYKRSGFGRTDHAGAVLDFTQEKAVLVQGLRGAP